MRRIIIDTLVGSVAGFALIFIVALLPGGNFFSVREIGMAMGLFILTLVSFTILLHLIAQGSPRLRWTVFLSANVVFAVWLSFPPIDIGTLRTSLFIVCTLLTLLNVIISSLMRRKMMS